jgi:hypothetical protein
MSVIILVSVAMHEISDSYFRMSSLRNIDMGVPSGKIFRILENLLHRYMIHNFYLFKIKEGEVVHHFKFHIISMNVVFVYLL